MRRGKHWLMAFGAVLCSWCASPAFADDASAADTWRSIETPHYSVLSQLGERDTRAWAAQFDVFVDSLSGMLGARDAELPPLTVVLFSPESRATAGCAVRLGTWGLSGTLRRGEGDALRRSMLRAGVHWLTSTPEVSQPAWLETGLAEVFSTFDVHGGHVSWGQPMPEHLALLRERGLIPLREFLDDPEAVVARDGDARRFTAQAWALTHLLLLGGDAQRRERVAASLRHPAPTAGDDAFRAAFLADTDRLQRDLQAYVQQPQLAAGMSPRGMVERKYRMTVASRPAVDAALGRLAPPASGPAIAATTAPTATP